MRVWGGGGHALAFSSFLALFLPVVGLAAPHASLCHPYAPSPVALVYALHMIMSHYHALRPDKNLMALHWPLPDRITIEAIHRARNTNCLARAVCRQISGI